MPTNRLNFTGMTDEKSGLTSTGKKVVAAFLLTCIALALAVATTYFIFDNLLAKMDELSAPNEKLKKLNHLFTTITRLDQQQRADAIRNPGKPYPAIVRESRNLTATLDSLIAMPWDDKRQPERLEAMKRIVAKRDFLLIDYLRLKSELLSDAQFIFKIDSLSAILLQNRTSADSMITTSERKTTTTTYLPEDKKRTFFNRLLGTKKNDSATARIEVKEEIRTRVDTLAIARTDYAIEEVGRMMKKMEEDKRMQSQEMLERELRLVNTNIALIKQLLTILREVERDELELVEKKNAEAASLVSTSVGRIGIIIIVFFLLAAVLVFLILIDISRSNFYRQQLIKAKEEAEQLSLVKQRFLANMSHEIRTPLQSIIGFSEQLNAGPQANPEIISAIQHSSEHLLHVVDEVLDFSRIESGQFSLEKEPFNLPQLLGEIAAVVRIQANRKHLSFRVEAPEFQTWLLGDPFRLRQIFYNLLSNAIKFTNEGEVKFHITLVEETPEYAQFQFEVSDTGKGIPTEEQEIIFNEFEQGKQSIHRQYGGAGLGLSIVKKLVELQNGTIRVHSEPGCGSTFTVVLGFERAPVAAADNYLPVQPVQPFDGEVWVVDDDPLIIKLVELVLQKHGIPYRTFENSQKVVEENPGPARLVLLDIRMPEINGIELCTILKSKAPNLRMVALTAHVMPAERKTIMEGGFHRILTKPFREQELMHAIYEEIRSKPEKGAAWDLTDLKKMTQDDPELLQSIIDQFIAETGKNLIDLEKKMLDRDAPRAREIIHQLAGRVGQFGARPLMKELQRLESQLASGYSIAEVVELVRVVNKVKEMVEELSKQDTVEQRS
jgi:signal transduction histidine kinase/CheY-like chemotaxis protein